MEITNMSGITLIYQPVFVNLLIKSKIGGASEAKMNKFILYFSQLALSLPPIKKAI